MSLSFLFLVLLLALAPGPAKADLPVDVELVLMADISDSMDMGERYLQRQGHLDALRHPDLLRAIESGLHRRIAATYVEWADPPIQRIILPWTLIEDDTSAATAADVIEASPLLTGSQTSVSAALDFARTLFTDNGYAGIRRVIDVSGDGRNNIGRPLTAARDDALAEGITINALAIMLRARHGGTAEVDTLDQYFAANLIGGPGSFVYSVRHRDHLIEAIRRKLVLEIAGLAGPIDSSGPSFDRPRSTK